MNITTEEDLKINEVIVAKLCLYPKALMEYYNDLLATGKTFRTAQTYVNVVTHFADYILKNGKSIVPLFEEESNGEFYEGIEPDDIEQFLEILTAKKDAKKSASLETKATNWSALNSFFNFLMPQYINLNPVAKVPRPEIGKKKSNHKLSPLEKQIILNAPIWELNLPIRTLSILKQANICTIGDLCDLSVEECFQIRNFGTASLRAINEALAMIGCSLRKVKREQIKRDENGDVIVTKSNWRREPYPDIAVTVNFRLELTDEQRAILKRGYIPTSMEHKWFYYYERGMLYIYRSWSGRCFYIVKLNDAGSLHFATAYAYEAKHVEELQKTAGEKIAKLLIRFTEPSFYMD